MSEAESSDTLQEIQRIVQEALGLDDPPDPDARLIEDLGAESLDIISLLFELEERFEREIPDERVAELTTVRAVADLVSEGGAGGEADGS